ncbi:MAG: kelch repeat-containing protein [Rhodothermales bacterium]
MTLGIGIDVFKEDPLSANQALFWRIIGDQNEPDERHEGSYIEVNGNFYLMGGRGSRRVELYDPVDSTWSNRSFPPNSMQIHHFQPVAIGDTVYIVSAYTETFPDEPTVDEVMKYAVLTDQWVVGSEIPVSRRRGAAGAVAYNGKIYVVGGSTGGHGSSSVRTSLFDEYDPVTDTWTSLTSAPYARDHVHAAVVGDKLYVAGGRDGSNGDTVEQVDVYDFITGQWSTLPSPAGDLPTPRAGAASVAVGDFVVVIGGESAQQLAHNEAEALNTVTNTWITLQPLNVGRHGTQAIFYNDNIYIASGSGEKGGGPELTSQEILETGGQTNLPVELAPDFTAQLDGETVRLSWQTLSETNSAGFEVEHQQNGTFTSLGFVRGAGTSVTAKRYSFAVNDLPPGRHVFRLKQIDFDGAFEYSPLTSVFIDVKGSFHLGDVYPNPFNPQARFTLSVAREQQVSIQIFDMLGRSIASIHDGILMPHEPHSFVIESSSWAGGKYLLVAEGTYFSASKNFTVLK